MGPARRRADRVEVANQALRLAAALRCAACADAKSEDRTRLDLGTFRLGAGTPDVVETLHVAVAHPLASEGGHDRVAARTIGARQRHQVLLRGVGRDPSLAHGALHRVGQHLHERESATDPARRASEAQSEISLRDPVLANEEVEQPPFLEGAPRTGLVEAVAQHEHIGERLFDHDCGHEVGGDRVERGDTLVPVDQDVRPLRTAALDHHDDGAQLPVNRDARSHPRRSCSVTNTKIGETEVEGVELEQHPPRLRTATSASDGVSRESGVNFRQVLRHFRALPVHCVSREVHEDFRRFLNHYGYFEADCVSRGRPPNFRRRISVDAAVGRGSVEAQTVTESTIAVVVRVRDVPPRARTTVALGLACVSSADSLPIACTRMRREPLPTDPTRTLATHRRPPLQAAERRLSSGHRVLLGEAHRGARWVDSHEQIRVISRER